MLILSLVVFQIIVFVSLILLLRRVLNKNVVSATRHIEELNQEYSQKEQELSRKLEEADLKSQSILKSSQEQAEALKREIIKEAESERDKIISQARAQSAEIIEQADNSRQALIAEVNQKIMEKALNQAAELIQQVLPERLRERIHRYWVDDLISSSFGDLRRLHIPEGDLEAKLVSAFPFTNNQRQALKAKIEEKLKRKIDIREEVDPQVVAGFIISLGSLVLDGSLRNKIKERTKSA